MIHVTWNFPLPNMKQLNVPWDSVVILVPIPVKKKTKNKKPSSNEFESSRDVSIGPNASSLVMVHKPVIIIP